MQTHRIHSDLNSLKYTPPSFLNFPINFPLLTIAGKGDEIDDDDDDDDNKRERGTHFTFIASYTKSFEFSCKKRWIGRNLWDVMKQEFGIPPENLCSPISINNSFIKVHTSTVPTPLKNGDIIQYKAHWNEPLTRISPRTIRVFVHSPDVILCDKPSGIPCVPQGRFQKLSLTSLLKQNLFQQKIDYCEEDIYLHPVSRLDRQTSGLVILARHAQSARILTRMLHQASKFYLAEVRGQLRLFTILESPYACWKYLKECRDSIIVCKSHQDVQRHLTDMPLFTREVDPNLGKPCVTLIKVLHITPTSSILLCQPLTGRTHQIRCHLAALGYPIINDQLYATLTTSGEPGLATLFAKQRRYAFVDPQKNTAVALTPSEIEHYTKTEWPQQFNQNLYYVDTFSQLHLHCVQCIWNPSDDECSSDNKIDFEKLSSTVTPFPEWIKDQITKETLDDAVCVLLSYSNNKTI